MLTPIEEIAHSFHTERQVMKLPACVFNTTQVCVPSLTILTWVNHRDKTRVQMPAKMFPHLKLLCLLLMGPTIGFDTKQRNSFLVKFGGFFYNKSKILTILFIVKYEKIAHFDEFLLLLGPIISRFFAWSNEEKINKNNKGCLL